MLSVALAAVIAVFSTGCGNSETQNDKEAYPAKPITMIVPYGAGGTTDIVGRQLASQLTKHLGVNIVCKNQPGASGSIGCKTCLDAPSDGYTVLFAADSLGTQRVMGISEMSYNDFEPIMAVANDPKVIVVNSTSKYETLEDLLKDMQERPGKVKMSYTGPGGSGHVQALIFNKLGYTMSMTSYDGGSACFNAVLGDQVDFTNSNFSAVSSNIESGNLRLLAVSANERLPQYPDVPTVSEIIPEAEEYLDIPFTPLSLLVKKDVPEEVKTALREACLKSVEEEDWKKFVSDYNLDKLYEKYPEINDIKSFYSQWESMVSWLLYDAGAAKISPEEFSIPRL